MQPSEMVMVLLGSLLGPRPTAMGVWPQMAPWLMVPLSAEVGGEKAPSHFVVAFGNPAMELR